MWQRMIERVDDFDIGEDDLGSLVRDLRGLFVEADPHDAEARSEFESHWSSIDAEHELRSEPWAPPGAASDDALARSLGAFRSWSKVSSRPTRRASMASAYLPNCAAEFSCGEALARS
jgi:hypothetical protein